MSEIHVVNEFDGNMGVVILLFLCCAPLGILHYVQNKRKMWICPECQESNWMQVDSCSSCDAERSDYE